MELRKILSEALYYVHTNNTVLYLETQSKVLEYFNELKSAGLTTGFFTDQFIKKNKAIVCLIYFIKFVVLLPFYFVGLITNYIPYILPSKIFESLKMEIEYKAPVEMVSGLITFPLFYTLMIFLFRNYVSYEIWLTFLLLISFPVCGYIAMYYWTELRRFARVVHFYFFMKSNRKIKLLQLRNEILDKIDEAKRSLVVE